MGHARREDLLDVADVLDAIRALPGVSERSPGIFYIGRVPFLHFHTREGDRWADAKAGRDWGPEVPLPFGARGAAKSAFLREVRARYEASVEQGSARRRSREGAG
jgi:hypothetical protein